MQQAPPMPQIGAGPSEPPPAPAQAPPSSASSSVKLPSVWDKGAPVPQKAAASAAAAKRRNHGRRVSGDSRQDAEFGASGGWRSPPTTPMQALDLPHINMICRTSFQKMVAQQSKQEETWTLQRRERDIAVRQRSRLDAAAWRRSCERKQREVVRRRKAEELEREPRASLGTVEEIDSDRDSNLYDKASPRTSPTSSMQLKNGEAPIQRMRHACVLTKNVLVLTRKPSKKKLEAQKKSARYRGLESRLEALPEAERLLLCDVFHLHDLDKDGQLSTDEVRHALGELGLQGVNAYERRELAQICADKHALGTCDVCEFSADLVPTARRALLKIRRGRLQEGLSACQRNWEGHYRLHEVFEAAKPCLPIELYEESETDPQWFEEVMEELKRHTQAFVFNDNVLALTSELMAISESVQRRVCVKRRQVQQSYGIDAPMFQKFQSELVSLERMFRRLDADSSGYLEPDEVMNVLMELGVVPKSSMEQRRITEMLEGLGDPSGASDFPSFLQIVEQVRQISETHAEDGWHRAFQGCLLGGCLDRDRSKRFSVDSFGSLKPTTNLHEAFQGSLERHLSDKGRISAEVPEEHTITVQQLRRILEDFGIVPAELASPRKRDSGIAEYELDPLELVLRDADPMGREEFNEVTVKRIGLRTKEIYRQRAFQYEAKKINDCNFSKEELEDLKKAFNSFDLDGSGTLSEKEILKLMNVIGVKFPREVLFRITFCELDTDGGGMLEFSEFVLFAKMHRDKEGPLKPETSPVTTLEALERSDLLALLDCSGIQFQAAVAAMGNADLVRRASDKLSVDPAASLSSAIGVNTLGELLNTASDLHRQAGGGPSGTSKTRMRG